MFKKDNLYYLSHPYTTYGDREKNLENARTVELMLYTTYRIKVVNPINILPKSLDDDIAMCKCRQLFDACDAIILCEGWQYSRGCREEYNWAIMEGKLIYMVTTDYEVEILNAA